MSFEVGPGMPRPGAPPQAAPHRPGVTPPPRDQPDPWYGKYILFPLFCLVILAGCAAWLFRYQIMRAYVSPDQSRWPTAEATVTRTMVETSRNFELARQYRYGRETRYLTTGYVPEVDYVFTVGGSTYTGSTLAYLPRVYDSETTAQRTLDRYPEKTRIRIRYDPQDPNDNCVDQGLSDLVGTWSDGGRY
jgi:hypothetical protein